jgi:hypothetical protein
MDLFWVSRAYPQFVSCFFVRLSLRYQGDERYSQWRLAIGLQISWINDVAGDALWPLASGLNQDQQLIRGQPAKAKDGNQASSLPL